MEASQQKHSLEKKKIQDSNIFPVLNYCGTKINNKVSSELGDIRSLTLRRQSLKGTNSKEWIEGEVREVYSIPVQWMQVYKRLT